MSMNWPPLIDRQLAQASQGSPFWMSRQLTALAMILAVVVLPLPLGPQNR